MTNAFGVDHPGWGVVNKKEKQPTVNPVFLGMRNTTKGERRMERVANSIGLGTVGGLTGAAVGSPGGPKGMAIGGIAGGVGGGALGAAIPPQKRVLGLVEAVPKKKKKKVSKRGPYDSEERRHQRLGAATATGAAGTAVLGVAGGKKVAEGASKTGQGKQKLARMAKPTGTSGSLGRSNKNMAHVGRLLSEGAKLQRRGLLLLGGAGVAGAGTAAVGHHARSRGKTYRAWYKDS